MRLLSNVLLWSIICWKRNKVWTVLIKKRLQKFCILFPQQARRVLDDPQENWQNWFSRGSIQDTNLCRSVSIMFHPVFNFPASVLEGCADSDTTSLLHFSHVQSPISVLENALTKLTFCNIFKLIMNRFRVNLDYEYRRHQTSQNPCNNTSHVKLLCQKSK